MAFTVSGLTDYVNQQSEELLLRAFYENKSSQHYGTLMTGIKHIEAIQILTITGYPQADTTCSNTASGDTAFTQREITVKAIKYHDTLCPKDLRVKWTQHLLRPGSHGEVETLTFEERIATGLTSLVKEHVERADWQGNTASGDAVLKMYDGLIKIIDAAGTAINGNTGNITVGTGWTAGASGNADTIINAMCAARTAALRGLQNQLLFVGQDNFDKYTNALMMKNLFHIDVSTYMNYTMQIPGTNVTLVGVPGLDGTNRAFLSYAENWVLGTDLENDMEEFKMWYSQDDDNVKYTIKFKRGVNVAFPSHVIQFKLV